MAYIFNISRTLLQSLIKKYGNYMTGRVLDVGGGQYNRYKHLLSAQSIVSLDVEEGPNVDVVGSADAIPFKDEEFDSVISTQVFEHLAYPEKAAAEIFRVLRPGGYLIITAPQWNELHEEPHDYWRFTCFGLTELFTRNGFSVVVYERCGGFFSTRTQMTMRYLIDRFNLYESLMGRIISKIFHIWGRFALWLDEHDTSAANKKHTIGWVFVFRK